ncbi:MAG: phage/plasmid primase, P4 family [Candidatus Omnitrophota bacterium]
MNNLQPKHLGDLHGSTLSDDTITKYGIASLSEAEIRAKLNRNDISGGGWLIQYPGSHYFKIKLDNPVGDRKYLSPAGMSQDLFITYLVQEKRNDVSVPYYFVEGEKKALAMEQLDYPAISIPGVWGWKSKGHSLDVLANLNVKNRKCRIVFDSDKYKNPHILKAEYELALYLRKRGATVEIVNLDGALGKGIDDQIKDFLSKQNIEDLRKHLEAPESYEDYIARNKNIGTKEKLTPVEIADKICQERHLIYCGENFYVYQGGVYRYIHEEMARRWILMSTGVDISNGKVNEILDFAKTCAYVDVEQLNNTALLNLKNGLFDIEKCALLPHTPDIYSTIQLQVTYNPAAKCDQWIQMLFEIFQGDEEKARTLQEFFGLCLTREMQYDRALMCVGDGATGKSVILNMLERMLGKENCVSIPLEKFDDAHYLANLFGKLANISIETNTKSEVYDSMFKAIISGDPIQADLKFKNSFKFHPFCKLIFAMNNLPRVNDKTNAFFRRLLILRFKREFGEVEQNKNLRLNDERNPLMTELDGIFIWCLEGLKRLRARGYFDITEQIQQEIDEYRKENNNVIIFVEEECSLSVELAAGKSDIYSRYADFCKNNGYRPLSMKRFAGELTKHFKGIEDDRVHTGRIWRGIGLNYPESVTHP